MDRNIWDKDPFNSSTKLIKKGLVIELCLYFFKDSAKDENKARTDVEIARDIWCQGGINVQAIHWERLSPLPISEPLDLNSSNLARQISCGGMSEAEQNQLFSIGRPNCPGNINKSIAVYYIPGRRLADGFASGCHRFRPLGGDGLPEHIILLTDEASGQVLAHELGHALFTRQIGTNTWINDDPDQNMDPSSKIHNKNSQNLMFPNVPTVPVISATQSAQAKSSHLVFLEDLVFGFKDTTPFKLDVSMKTMHVEWTDDELFSDDALESSWDFHVKTKSGKTDSKKSFSDNRLNPGDRDLSSNDLGLKFSVEMASDSDELIINLTGEDWDFWSPNDSLPTLGKTWTHSDSLWGSGLSTSPSGILGEHKDGPHTNDEMEYWLTYQISLISKPDNDVIFRHIC